MNKQPQDIFGIEKVKQYPILPPLYIYRSTVLAQVPVLGQTDLG